MTVEKEILWEDGETKISIEYSAEAEEGLPPPVHQLMQIGVWTTWVPLLLEARRRFNKSVKEINLTFGETRGRNYVGNATKDGFRIFINPQNLALEYNCFKHAVFFHEYAHWVDLEGKPGKLDEFDIEEIEVMHKDPRGLSVYLRDEYRANRLMPLKDRVWLFQLASTYLLGAEEHNFLQRCEKEYGDEGYVVALVPRGDWDYLVKQLLPIYMALRSCDDRRARLFLGSMEAADADAASTWLAIVKAVRKKLPCQIGNHNISYAVIGRQIPPREIYHFEIMPMFVGSEGTLDERVSKAFSELDNLIREFTSRGNVK